jgi:hypothetical protein
MPGLAKVLGAKPGTGVTLIISDSLAPQESYAAAAELTDN